MSTLSTVVVLKLLTLSRICIGRHLADNSIWMTVATMLATMNINKRVDEHGHIIEPRVEFTNGGTW